MIEKASMLILTEDTPNPDTMKFLPGRNILGEQCATMEIADAKAAAVSPLAQTLLSLEGVKSVFLGRDFITVTRKSSKDWAALKPVVLTAIMEHFVDEKPVLTAKPGENKAPCSCKENDIIGRICRLLDEKVRPAVEQDGGDIVFHSFEDGIVYLTLKGACAGCPSATATLKMGVERMLKHFIPEVREVRQKKR